MSRTSEEDHEPDAVESRRQAPSLSSSSLPLTAPPHLYPHNAFGTAEDDKAHAPDQPHIASQHDPGGPEGAADISRLGTEDDRRQQQASITRHHSVGDVVSQHGEGPEKISYRALGSSSDDLSDAETFKTAENELGSDSSDSTWRAVTAMSSFSESPGLDDLRHFELGPSLVQLPPLPSSGRPTPDSSVPDLIETDPGFPFASTSTLPPVSTRLTYVQDENGHHRAVGREGTLTRCEDEVRSALSLPARRQLGFLKCVPFQAHSHPWGNPVLRSHCCARSRCRGDLLGRPTGV